MFKITLVLEIRRGSLEYLALMAVVLRGNRKLFDLEMILSPVIIEDVAKVSVTHRVTKVKSNENGSTVKTSLNKPSQENVCFPHLQKQFCLQIFPRRGHSDKYWGKKLIIRKLWVFIPS